MEIIRLRASDFEEAMDLINLVFSQAYAPSCFEKMLPLLYQPTDSHMRRNFALRENGKLRAIVGLFPAQVQAGNEVLSLGGIGGVSTHPNDRGKGWMRHLMNRCLEEMQSDGTDLSFLIGLRQRYQYYGYEKAGALAECKVGKTNFKHTQPASPAEELRFKKLLPEDTELIAAAKALYDRQPIRCIRSGQEFYLYLLSLHMQPWAALNQDGSLAGYLVCDAQKRRISELIAHSDTAMPELLRAWFAQQDAEESTVILPAFQESQLRSLTGLAEEFHLVDNGNWRIFRWDRVADALIKVRSAWRPLREGSLSVGIQGYGTIRFTVQGKAASCEKTSARPDVEWDPFTAIRILFGHAPARWVAEVPEAIRSIVEDWFPLPLSWLPQNYV